MLTPSPDIIFGHNFPDQPSNIILLRRKDTDIYREGFMFNQPTKRTLWQSWTISLCVLFRFVYLATFGSRNETLAGRIFWTKINQYGDRLRWTRIDCDVPSASLALSQFFFPPLFSYSNGQKDRWTCNDTLLLTTLTITREKEKLEKKVKEKNPSFSFPV